MYRFSTYKRQYKANLKLALPVVMTQLGQILVQVADNVMVGRYGGDDPTPLAATSFGGSVFFIPLHRRRRHRTGPHAPDRRTLRPGRPLQIVAIPAKRPDVLYSVGISGLRAPTGRHPFDVHMGQPVEVVDMAIPYYKLLAYSMPFIMLFFTFKQFLEASETPGSKWSW